MLNLMAMTAKLSGCTCYKQIMTCMITPLYRIGQGLKYWTFGHFLPQLFYAITSLVYYAVKQLLLNPVMLCKLLRNLS